jgi:pimeloyl-ACP methyl ester carboxylesterase
MSADDLHTSGTDTIVLIHGLWLTALSWENWIGRYRARGYRVLAPNWPGMDAGIEELRRHPSTIASLGMTEIADHYDHLIRGLGHPPAIIGHSVGGLVAQVLLDRGLGAVGVAIDPAPVKGSVRLPLPLLRAGLPGMRNPAHGYRTIRLTPGQFQHVFANTLSQQQAAAVRERYYVPAPGRTVRQVGFASFSRDASTSVDFNGGQRAPLLLIGSGQDRIFPVTATRSIFMRYRQSKAVTAYKEFPERSHYTIGEPGWERVADYTLRWAMENALTGT